MNERPIDLIDLKFTANDHKLGRVSAPSDVCLPPSYKHHIRGLLCRKLTHSEHCYGKSVAVSMDIVDEGQAHLDALQELAERRQRINREKTPAEAT